MGPNYYKHRRFTSSLAVAALAVAAYLNSISGEFVFDDREAIETNPDVGSSTIMRLL